MLCMQFIYVIIVNARVRSTTGRYCFHRCLSVHTGGGPHLHLIILPLVPCPFWRVPPVLGWGIPQPGQDLGIPNLGWGTPPQARTTEGVLATRREVCLELNKIVQLCSVPLTLQNTELYFFLQQLL